jgi:hypothetical protein
MVVVVLLLCTSPSFFESVLLRCVREEERFVGTRTVSTYCECAECRMSKETLRKLFCDMTASD